MDWLTGLGKFDLGALNVDLAGCRRKLVPKRAYAARIAMISPSIPRMRMTRLRL